MHGAGEADIADSDELSDSAEAAPDDDISMADDSHVDVNVNGGEDQQERFRNRRQRCIPIRCRYVCSSHFRGG